VGVLLAALHPLGQRLLEQRLLGQEFIHQRPLAGADMLFSQAEGAVAVVIQAGPVQADQQARGGVVRRRQGDAAAVEGDVLVRGQSVKLPGLAGGGIDGGVCFPVFPAVVVPGAGGDDRLTGGEGRRLFVAPVAGEASGLHAVVGLPDHQQLAAVLLKDHRTLSSSI
jgi:hypothetical protein